MHATTTTPTHATPPRSRLRHTITSSAIAVALALIAAVGFADRADAAELGPGYQEVGRPLNHLGGYLVAGGSVAYCIQVGLPSTVGAATTAGGVVGQVNGLPPSEMLKLDSVLARHGQTTDARTAAAVAMTVWGIADAADYAAAGGDAHVLLRAPEAERAAISALAAAIRAEAAAVRPVTVSVELELSIAAEDEADGDLEVAVSPSSAAATITLTGGTFADSDLAVRHGVTGRTSLPIRATPPVDGAPYRVSATTDDVLIGGLPGGTVNVYSTPNAQTLVTAGPPVSSSARGAAQDSRDRAVPGLSTVAQPTAIVGGTVHDLATVSGLPKAGAELTWSGYLQPASSASPVCVDETRVYRSPAPSAAPRDGVYPSEDFAVGGDHLGTVFWVATLTGLNGTILAEGTCGEASETTTITASPRLPVVSG